MPHGDSDAVGVTARTLPLATARIRSLPRVVTWGVLALAAALGALALAGRTRGRIPVEITLVVRGPVVAAVASITTGTVESEREVQAAFQISGTVAEVFAREGDHVAAGQPLARLDDREARANFDLSRANLAAAAANLERARAYEKLRAATIETDEAGAAAADERSRADLLRLRRLFKEGIASQQDLDRAEAEARIAEAAAAAAHARRGEKEMAARDVAAAAAAVEQARASVETARVALDRCTLTAPFEAVVSSRDVQVGQTVAPVILATSPLFTLVDRRSLHVRASFDEVDAARIRTGLLARLTLDAFPDRAFDGSVAEISPVISTTRLENRSVSVKIAFAGDVAGVMPGMSADAEIRIDRKDAAAFVPSDAVMDRESRRYVYVVDGGVARRREVVTGLSNWDVTEIVSGVVDGDRVIVTLDIPDLRDGAAVRVAGTRSAAP